MMSSGQLALLFKYRHFDCGVIILCVRRYVRCKLSYRELGETMAGRGIKLAHTAAQRLMPEFEKR